MEILSLKVLLIEDDPDDAFLTRGLLVEPQNGPRFTLERVGTLKEGLQKLKTQAFDAILLDLSLPDSRGIETFLTLSKEIKGTPILPMTGWGDGDMALRLMRLGAQDYLAKGAINASGLQRALLYAIERKRLMHQFETIIEKNSDAVVVIDSTGQVLYANPASEILLGRSKPDLLSQPFGFQIIPNQSAELKFKLPSGEERIAEVRAVEIEWHGKTVCLASIRDMTEIKRSERLHAEMMERRRMDKLKDEFIGSITHELRSPLTILKAVIGNLLEGQWGEVTTDQTDALAMAQRSTDRLVKMTNNLLDLSRLESGRANPERQKVDLAPLILEIVKGFQLIANQRGAVLESHLPENLPPAYVDPEMIVEVLSNLIDNAFRFARKHVTLNVHQSSNGFPGIQIDVTDDGPGIAKDKMDFLFTKFMQLKRQAGKGDGYKGTGLGLAICKQIVDLNEGKIWVESDGQRGTSFHIILPICKVLPHTGTIPEEKPQAMRGLR